jgi:hypothetical protein
VVCNRFAKFVLLALSNLSIAAVDPTDNEVLAITAWAGTSLTDAAYEIIPAADSTTSSARLRDLLAQMSVIEANGRGLFYRFSDSVSDADPGSGYLRLNNATIGSATAAYLDNLDANGATVSSEFDTWDGDGIDVDNTDPTAPIVEFTEMTRLTNWVNIVELGADPTGVADCATVMKAAKATGLPVYAPKGVYRMATSLRSLRTSSCSAMAWT